MAFRDNDSLAALLAIELKADLLVLLTDVMGLYDGPPADPKSNFIPTYCPEVHDELIKFGDASKGGRGGMVSKVGPLVPNWHSNSNASDEFPRLTMWACICCVVDVGAVHWGIVPNLKYVILVCLVTHVEVVRSFWLD